MRNRDTEPATCSSRWAWVCVAAVIGVVPMGFVVGAVDRVMPGRTHCSDALWLPFVIDNGAFDWSPNDGDRCSGTASLVHRDRAVCNVFAPVIWWTERLFIARRFDGSDIRGPELDSLRVSLSAELAREGDAHRARQALLPGERRWRVLWPGVFKNGVGGYAALLLVLVARRVALRLGPPNFAPGLCRQCGYDVSRCVSPMCPECGEQLTA